MIAHILGTKCLKGARISNNKYVNCHVNLCFKSSFQPSSLPGILQLQKSYLPSSEINLHPFCGWGSGIHSATLNQTGEFWGIQVLLHWALSPVFSFPFTSTSEVPPKPELWVYSAVLTSLLLCFLAAGLVSDLAFRIRMSVLLLPSLHSSSADVSAPIDFIFMNLNSPLLQFSGISEQNILAHSEISLDQVKLNSRLLWLLFFICFCCQVLWESDECFELHLSKKNVYNAFHSILCKFHIFRIYNLWVRGVLYWNVIPFFCQHSSRQNSAQQYGEALTSFT